MTRQLHIQGLFPSTDEIWENVLAALRRLPNTRSQEEWLQGSRAVRLEDGEITIQVPHKFAKEFIEKRCRQTVERTIEKLLGEPLRVCFVVAEEESAESPPQSPDPAPAPKRTPAANGHSGTPLNRRYQFDTFVCGESTRFACAAAMAVANAPGHLYNPLFLCGGPGLGKTHLLQAIGHEVARVHPSLRIAHVSADAFTYEWVSSLRERRTDVFRRRYRNADVWLVDDVQFIAQKKATGEEFFLTFTALYEAGRQIVLASNCYPRDMGLLDDRLRSRMESGVIAEVGSPELDARVTILRRRAETEGVPLSEDVLLYIANLVHANVRTLEGALIKLIAYASLTGKRPTSDLARGVLEGYFGRSSAVPVTVGSIQQAVCNFFKVEVKAVKSKRRDREVMIPRQMAMYLCRRATQAPLTEIGQHFGGRDHSTVISACKKIDASLQEDAELRTALQEISRRLGLPPT